MHKLLFGVLAAITILASDPILKNIKPVMLVCQSTDKDGKNNGIVTKWDIDTKVVVPTNCKIVSSRIVKEDQVSSTANGMSALENELKTVCAPCIITPGQWGQCPGCLILDGGCAKACPVPQPLHFERKKTK